MKMNQEEIKVKVDSPSRLSKEEQFLIDFADKTRIESLTTIRNYLKLMLPINPALIAGYLTMIELVLKGHVYHIVFWYMIPPICFLVSTACAVWGLLPMYSESPGGTIDSYHKYYIDSVEKRKIWIILCFASFLAGIAAFVLIPWLVPLGSHQIMSESPNVLEVVQYFQ